LENLDDVAKRKVLGRSDESGFPLQRYCANELDRLGWRVDEEFSVATGKPEGSHINVIETTGDVHAQKRIGRAWIHLVVECKRRHGSHWNFFRDLNSIASSVFPEVVLLPDHSAVGYYVTLPYASWEGRLSSYSVGWENTNKGEQNVKNEVRDAAIQAWTATLSVLGQTRKELNETLTEIFGEPDYEREVFIPLVVTGALLLELKPNFSGYKVGELTGEVETMPYLVFRPGIPSYLNCKIDSPLPPAVDRDSISRPDVVVVHYSELVDFIAGLVSAINKSDDKMYEKVDFFPHFE
jgi:hypothetical protein